MKSLATRSANSQSDKKFGSAEVNFTGSQTLYCMVQCSPEMSADLCMRCLESAVGSLPQCCSGKQGGKHLPIQSRHRPLSSNATRATGFSNASAGEVSGLFLCRGDVNPTVCQDCVANGTIEILGRCPLDKVAIIWYDECLLRCSNQPIFATVNVVPAVSMSSTQVILEAESDRFNELLSRTMNSLATLASNSLTAMKFATEEEAFNSSQTLYSLVQCTPDLTESDCEVCFQSAIGGLPMCCGGKQGGRVLLPSCNIRYELYSFYNFTAASPAFPPPAPGGSKMSSLTIIVTIVIAISVSVVLFFIAYCFLRRRARKKCYTLSEENVGDEITTIESLQFDLDIIEAATDKFSDDNKIGEGGFGAVYKEATVEVNACRDRQEAARKLGAACGVAKEAVGVGKVSMPGFLMAQNVAVSGGATKGLLGNLRPTHHRPSAHPLRRQCLQRQLFMEVVDY
ncbi:cysteine-rich receptor-like protein kinase 25 [Alnus glutinosa]|uniref:cysteine-rich receptor-like protein kinase 25 n=1 Tax=Alnus glutinosa TaxID=3517 RepID=UPI002D79888E|nr:cysteine-rich receptor-like protein kinase 25 [Alnus glutinosa]